MGMVAANVYAKAPPQPDTLYGATKLAAEALVLAAQRHDGVALGVVLRLAAVYGARVKGNYQRLLDAVARGCFVPLGHGGNRRTLVYDRDVAAAPGCSRARLQCHRRPHSHPAGDSARHLRGIRPAAPRLYIPLTPPAASTLTRALTPFAGGQAALDAQRPITPTATLTATVTPTATATVTPTVPPTVTPPPRHRRPPGQRPPRPSPTPTIVAGVVTPLNPLTGESSNGVVRFEWSANFTPSEGYAFELVFWRPQQEPLKQGFGVAAPTRGHEAKVDLRELDNRLGDRLEPGAYQWGLLLVRTQPTYARIRYVGGDWLVTYNR